MSGDPTAIARIGRRLLVTFPGNPTDDTITALQERVLAIMDGERLSGVVLDISAAEIVDSYFARVIAELGDMVRLMGGETVVTGIRPNVALTLTELGLDLGGVRTAVDVEEGLRKLGAAPSRGA